MGFMSFLVNLFGYFTIQTTSSTTFKVAGCVKNVVVVAAGVWQGDHVTPRELQGFALSMLGFLLYTWARARGAGHKAA
jgi:hypothetical protein